MADVRRDKRSESTAELVKDLSREVGQLVREEIALARAEMTEKGKSAGPVLEADPTGSAARYSWGRAG